MKERFGKLIEHVDSKFSKSDAKFFFAGAAILASLFELYGVPSGNYINLPALIIAGATGITSARI